MPDAASVSVIVPVYNGEAFLAEALESVFRQETPALEVIVVDDGSTDGSAEVAEARVGVRCIRMPHGGVSAARNRAIEESAGAWLAFLDADDRWLPQRLSVQLEASKEMPEVSIFLGWKRIVIEQPRPEWYDGPGDGSELPSYEPSVWLVRRDAFDVVGMFDTSRAIGEDTDWLARAADAGTQMHVCQEAIAERRIHASNASGVPYDRKGIMLEILRQSVHRKRPAGESR